jgi:hypothetical protein
MGTFSIFCFLFLLFMAICYWIAPKFIIAEKSEYVKFFLIFFTCYFALEGIVSLALYRLSNFSHSELSDLPLYSVLLLCPALFVFHLFYSFKTVKKNQHLSFFLFFASLFSVCVGLFCLALALSNM